MNAAAGGIFVCCAFLAGCSTVGQNAQRAALGAVDIENEWQIAALPARPPRVIYVADFRLDRGDFSGDRGIQGALPGQDSPPGLLGKLAERLPHPFADRDPAARVEEIVGEMSQALIGGLEEKGLAARRFADGSRMLPGEGWLLQGTFVAVDEGNRLERAAVGVGQGATRMEVVVSVTDLSADALAPFLVFGTEKDAGRLPGGAAASVATRTPYAAAARFVMERNATPRDVKSTASQIAAEIARCKERIENRIDQ